MTKDFNYGNVCVNFGTYGLRLLDSVDIRSFLRFNFQFVRWCLNLKSSVAAPPLLATGLSALG